MRSSTVVLLLWGAISLAGCSQRPKQATTAAHPAARAEVGVEQLAKTPATFAAVPLALRGVVSEASAGEHRFVVIDEAEYQSCKELNCSAYEVPVAFAGALPETARTVRIVGRLTQPEPGRYLLQADSVEVVK